MSSISRFVGTMLNGADSDVYFVVVLLKFPSQPVCASENCDWLCQSISRNVGTMLNGTVSRVMSESKLFFFLPYR